jgi:hypothetical protein
VLREFALSPDVLFASAYGITTDDGTFHPSDHHGQLALNALRKGLERGGIVRNLAAGEWLNTVMSSTEGLHPRSREVLLKIQKSGRLVPAKMLSQSVPTNETEWLSEALASHQAEPLLSQFFGTDNFSDALKAADYQLLPKGISKLPFCEPFAGGGCSVKVKRTLGDYKRVLYPIFKHSRSLMFIDPYLDLTEPNYGEFVRLLRDIAIVRPSVQIELHRQLRTVGAGNSLVPADEWQNRFKQAIDADEVLRTLDIKVFVWDEFHDRYLISNLMGISVPYGFDTSKKEDETRWTMLSPGDADDVRVEFSDGDPQKRRKLQ